MKRLVNPRDATEQDEVIGQRLRTQRLALRISQQEMGDALGVSFQQIQKYEKGINRLSGARLVKAAELLRIDVGRLLGAKVSSKRPEITFLDSFLASKEGIELARCFELLKPRKRIAVVELVRSMTDKSQ